MANVLYKNSLKSNSLEAPAGQSGKWELWIARGRKSGDILKWGPLRACLTGVERRLGASTGQDATFAGNRGR